MPDTVLLIDAHNFMWRANIKFGAPKKAEGAVEDDKDKFVMIYNFFRNLRATIEQFKPDKIFCVLEGHPKFRYDLLSSYKENRIVKTAEKQEARDSFHQNKREILRLLKYLPVTQAKAADYECDDVIATLVDDMAEEHCIIISNDSDYLQLLQKGYQYCQIYNPMKKEFMAKPVYPYVAWKSLAGDKSDNIPGLMSKNKAIELALSPTKLSRFLEVEEQRANFNINRQLIEFKMVPKEEILLTEGEVNFSQLREEFRAMKFDSMTDDYWKKFCNTFTCVKY